MTLSLYDGAYGPTLRIDTHSDEELRSILAVFESLSSGATERVDFLKVIAPSVEGLSSLLLLRSTKSQDKVLVEACRESQQRDLTWSGNEEYWLDCLDMARVLLKKEKPAHQYLTSEGVDDALVELCHLESPQQPG